MTRKLFLIISIAAVVLLTAAVAVIFTTGGFETRLVVCDSNSGKVYGEYKVSQGDEFSVSFVHSVNLTEVTDGYYVDGDSIVCDKCVYSSFGAGMPTEWNKNWNVSYNDGKITVSGIDIRKKEFNYIVGTVYDHILCVGNEKIILNDLCGKNAEITLKLKKPLFG